MSTPDTTPAFPAQAGTAKARITRRGDSYLVNTGVFMSDLTYQEGLCTLTGNVLRFPGVWNRLPFRVNLSPATLAAVLALADGETLSR